MRSRPTRAIPPTGWALALALIQVGCSEAEAPRVTPPFPLDAPVLTSADLVADSGAYLTLLDAEDRRAPTDADLNTLLAALEADSEGLRRAAARALGRLERAGLADVLFGVASDTSAAPTTRAEAANAVAQSVRAADPAARAAAVQALGGRLADETDPVAGAALARALGRIPPADVAQAGAVASALAAAADRATFGDPAARLGLARAAFFHARVTQRGYPGYDLSPLLPLVGDLLADPDPVVRRAAAATRRSIPRAPTDSEQAALVVDSDEGVRREAMLWAGARSAEPFEPWQLDWLRIGLADQAPEVRLAAVQGWAARARETEGCGPLIEAALGETGGTDPGDAVSLMALATLTPACADTGAVQAALGTVVEAIHDDATAWHRPTAALTALSAIDPSAARTALPAFVDHPNPFVRTAAASTAARLGANEIVRGLVADPDANVREAALLGWGDAAPDEVVLAQLERDEPQLLRAAAAVLEGRAATTLAPALLVALDRNSSPVRATMRDARLALLRRAIDLGDAGLRERVAPYRTDPDPAVADLAASALARWGGASADAAPAGLPSPPLPSFAELAALEDSVAVVTMASGDRFVIATLPFEAPTNSARFMRMIRAGEFEGLTWHRVVPNFVVQGGSPHANEYAGHGDFSRDEIGLVGHFAATLGISTRGRDTGDGQPFFNLVDNLRLDHDYTVFGYVAEGFDAVRRIRAGDVIETTEVRAR